MHMTITDDFSALGLSEQMLAAVRAKGFETPTAIQKLTIPHLLTKPNDIIAQSQTGTGKTAAYGLPILQTLEPARGPIQAIILVPTRELALQAAEELLSYNREKRLSITAIYGGAAMSEQLRRLAKGIDIVVGTPGRVLDHIRRGTMKLENVRYLVLDEADEMLNMGFVEDVEEIMSHTSDERRVLLFSATMPERIIRLSKTYMRDTEIVRVEHKQITADLTEQIYFEVREADKFDALTRIIDVEPEFYGIIFARTKIGADETASRLTARGYAAEVLHGDVSQAQREKILRKFRDRTINILVATDVAARGIDVGNLTHVINYSLPQDSESYVHRIGRTGRAGKQGTAITFVSPSEFRGLNNLMRDIKVEIKRETLPSPQDIVEMKRLKIKEEMQEIVENESYDGYKEFAEELLAEYTPRRSPGCAAAPGVPQRARPEQLPRNTLLLGRPQGDGTAVPGRGQTRRLHGTQAGRHAQIQMRPARQIYQRRPDFGQLLVRERPVPRCRGGRPQTQPAEPRPPADGRDRPRRGKRGAGSPGSQAPPHKNRGLPGRRADIRPGTEKADAEREAGNARPGNPDGVRPGARPRRNGTRRTLTRPNGI